MAIYFGDQQVGKQNKQSRFRVNPRMLSLWKGNEKQC